MGGESEPVRVRASGAPLRCPFCHAAVERDREAWVACHNCLAPHHSACWREGGACAGCGEKRCVEGPAPPAVIEERSPATVFEVELRGRRAHFEGDPSFVLLVRPPRAETFEVKVRNETDAVRRVALRELPSWLRIEGPAEVEIPPASRGVLRFGVDLARSQGLARGTPVDGTLVLASEEDARTIRFEAKVAPEVLRAWKGRRFKLAAAMGVIWAIYATLLFGYRFRLVDELAQDGVMTKAVVTELTPRNHNQMYYSYEVNGVRYDRNDFSRVKSVGETVDVRYLPRDPSIAVLGNECDHLALPGFMMAPFMILLVGTGGLTLSGVMIGMKQPKPKR